MIRNFKKFSIWVSIAVVVGTLISVFFLSKLELDYDFESFFPQNDPETVFYKNYRSTFESDNDLLIVAVKNNKGIFKEDFLLQANSLKSELKQMSYVEGVVSILDSIEAKKVGLFGEIYSFPALHINQPERLDEDSTYIMNHPDYPGNLVSKDGTSLCFWVKHEEFLSKTKCDTLTQEVHEILDRYTFDGVHLAGRSIAQKAYLEMMAREMVIFMSLSMLLIVVFLFIAFRSIWGIVVPVTIVLLAIVWNLAAIYLLGNKIDLMLSILPTIIFVVGMSDAVHITTKYLDELRAGTEKKKAINIALREVGLATLLTSITTAIGFLSLLTSNIMPISKFGVNMAIGVILAFVLSYTILPVVFYLIKKPKITEKPKTSFDWKKLLGPRFIFVLRNWKILLLVSVGVISLSLWGISKVVSDNYLLEDLRKDHYLRKEIAFFEQNYAGARPMEVALILNDDIKEFDLELLRDIEKIDNYLENTFGIGALMSPVKIIKKSNQVFGGGELTDYKLPDSKRKLKKLIKAADRAKILSNFVNFEEGYVRIYGQSQDLGRRFYDKKLDSLDTFISQEFTDASFDVKVTGTARLMDLNNENLSKTMIYGLMLAFVVIAIIVGIMFKSVIMVPIALIPNVLPLMFVAAFMGFYDIPLKVSTSIIFTIAFGIAVDDTIHFLSKYRIELSKNKSKLYALKRTYLSTGKAIIVTTAILCGGFLTLIFSDFLGTLYTGLLIGMTLFFAVISDLILLPILLLLFHKHKKD